MKIALMTYEGTLHTVVDWDGRFSDHTKNYLKLPGDNNYFTAALAIKPEDVDAYVTRCAKDKETIDDINHKLIQFKVELHRKLMPLTIIGENK